MEGRTNQKRAALTAAEKKYRRKNELCMYCGDSDHTISECSKCPTKRKTMEGISDPNTPQPHKCVLRPCCSTVATLKLSDDTPKDVGLLTLPRELRNKVYEDLLCLDEYQIQVYQDGRKLKPNILGVSSQIYHEASEILYDENGWITVTIAESTKNSLFWDRIDSTSGFPGCRTVTRYENDKLSQSAILHMDVQQGSDTGAKMVDLVIPLAAMPRFCRLVTQSHWVTSSNLYLRFNDRAKERQQTRLLNCLGQARGFRRVGITNPEPSWATLNTVLLMTHQYTRMAEVLNTVSVYQSSTERESNHGRILSARNLLQDGIDFIDWWLEMIETQVAQLEDIDDVEMDELLEARADMGFSCASLSLRLGGIILAQGVIESVLEKLSRNNHLRTTHKARAHYHMAQTFEASGSKNAALYGYLQALALSPHYQDADDAVNQMERNLGSSMTLEDAKIKHNIEHVLTPFRSQCSSFGSVSKREYQRIFQEFDGTAAEICSLSRRSRGETDLIYMNPKYRVDVGWGNDD